MEIALPYRSGSMDKHSFALRQARIVHEELRHFTGTTFPSAPFEGCVLKLRRLEAFGMVADKNADQWVDMLDQNGDILHEVPVTTQGFNYLRRTLKFVREQ